MPRVLLDPDGTLRSGLYVIVEFSTGVVYSTQCAGLATEDRSIEGFLIPVGGPAQAQRIYDWFWSKFKGNCYPTAGSGNPWDPGKISELRELVSEVPCWSIDKHGKDQRSFLQLDESSMDECVEAWIPVTTPFGPGVLTLDNSD